MALLNKARVRKLKTKTHDFLQRTSEHVQKQQQTALRLMAFN